MGLGKFPTRAERSRILHSLHPWKEASGLTGSHWRMSSPGDLLPSQMFKDHASQALSPVHQVNGPCMEAR